MNRRDVITTTAYRFMFGLAGIGTTGFVSSNNPTDDVVVNAGEFTPGGTLVDRDVGILVGNAEASASRKVDNSNVIFSKDYYYKFGTAVAWLEPGSDEFPKTMPFVPSQQRYDAIKKYKERILRGQDVMINEIKIKIDNNEYKTIAEPSDPIYSIRPYGLLANAMLASENTGEKNELLLCRWYINEMYLSIYDIRMNSSTQQDALKYYNTLIRAMNSYYTLLNRVITPKISDPFEYIK